jgi:hypothetical protein
MGWSHIGVEKSTTGYVFLMATDSIMYILKRN